MPPGSGDNDELAMLCAQLPVLRRLHRGPVGAPSRKLLEQAIAAAREGRPVGGYLEALGLTPEPDPWPDAEMEIAPGARSPGALGPTRGGGPTCIDSEPLFFAGAYVCPRGACGRAEHRLPGASLPECAVFDEALRFDEDS